MQGLERAQLAALEGGIKDYELLRCKAGFF
jgi:hypothetical protein